MIWQKDFACTKFAARPPDDQRGAHPGCCWKAFWLKIRSNDYSSSFFPVPLGSWEQSQGPLQVERENAPLLNFSQNFVSTKTTFGYNQDLVSSETENEKAIVGNYSTFKIDHVAPKFGLSLRKDVST